MTYKSKVLKVYSHARSVFNNEWKMWDIVCGNKILDYDKEPRLAWKSVWIGISQEMLDKLEH